MKKNLRIFAQTVLALATIAFFVVILTKLPQVPGMRSASSRIIREYTEQAQKEKILLEQDKAATERLKLALVQAKIRQTYEAMPRMQELKEFRAVVWTFTLPASMFFVSFCLPVIFWFKSKEIAAVIVSLKHQESML